MPTYKVVKDEGLTVNEVVFEKGDMLELGHDEVAKFLEDGSLVEASEADLTPDDLGDEPTLPGEADPV